MKLQQTFKQKYTEETPKVDTVSFVFEEGKGNQYIFIEYEKDGEVDSHNVIFIDEDTGKKIEVERWQYVKRNGEWLV